MLFDVTV